MHFFQAVSLILFILILSTPRALAADGKNETTQDSSKENEVKTLKIGEHANSSSFSPALNSTSEKLVLNINSDSKKTGVLPYYASHYAYDKYPAYSIGFPAFQSFYGRQGYGGFPLIYGMGYTGSYYAGSKSSLHHNKRSTNTGSLSNYHPHHQHHIPQYITNLYH